MRVIYVTKRTTPTLGGCVLSLGIFDGLHLGHQYIIKQLLIQAKSYNLGSVILTFIPHPANVLNSRHPVKLLTTQDKRLKLLEKLGVDLCLIIRFNKKFAKLSAERFVRDLIVAKIKPQTVIVGCDFRFGKNGEGDVKLLLRLSRLYGFKLKIIASRKKSAHKISSSLIRKLLESGRIEDANRFLGRPYSLEGQVLRGARLGRRIGFPTINLSYDSRVVLPLGIFSGLIDIGEKRYLACIYIGFKPTFLNKRTNKRTRRPIIEVHILSFKKNIYGEIVEIFLISKIRNDKKFNRLKDLKLAIKEDIRKTKKTLKFALKS